MFRWFALLVSVVGCAAGAVAADRPNILWISTEDISPDLGCYGDPYAITPHLDQFASQGVRFTRCFAHAGVCAPARSGLITGMYPPSIGTHHMRCKGVPPAEVRCFPEYLRAAGYYCTNNSKTDYQFDPPLTAWDESSGKADWRGRAPGQPFFCVLNFTNTHESQIRSPSGQTQKMVAALPEELRHDPAKAVVPPYYPDTPLVRQDLANYADNITAMDRQVAEVLERLEADGLAEDTIVWFWGDHGRGLPRCKRWLYDSGTLVPLIIRVPEKWRQWASPGNPEAVAPGTVREDLVAFVDFAPTMLSLAGLDLPAHFQGQAFLGAKQAAEPRQYIHGHRDRMDEAYDLIRMVRDKRFKYFRNFMTDVSYGQDIWYMNQMPTMREMRRLHAEGKLHGGPAQYFRPTKPVEELFDTEKDPHELNNLALDPQYADVLQRMRAECERWMTSIGDIGLLPEPIFDEFKRPGADWQQAFAPVVTEQQRDGQIEVSLSSPLPGARFGYAVTTADTAPGDRPHWRLYDQPFLVPSGQQLMARSCRLGFRDSETIRWTSGHSPTPPKLGNPPAHWRDAVATSGVLERLRRLLSVEAFTSVDSLPMYRDALADESPAVRYWAIRRLLDSNRTQRPDWLERQVRDLRAKDPAPLVQVITARTLAEWDDDPEQVRHLAHLMRTDPHDSLRLYAAIALRDLGERARPALNQLQAASKDGEYVGRVSQAVLEQLKAPQRTESK